MKNKDMDKDNVYVTDKFMFYFYYTCRCLTNLHDPLYIIGFIMILSLL